MNDRDLLSLFASGIVSGILFWAYEFGLYLADPEALIILIPVIFVSTGLTFIFGLPVLYVIRLYFINKDIAIYISGAVISTIVLCNFKSLYPWEYPVAPIVGLLSSFTFLLIRKILPKTIK